MKLKVELDENALIFLQQVTDRLSASVRIGIGPERRKVLRIAESSTQSSIHHVLFGQKDADENL